jgi:SAM-dependent methyltransferase
MSDFEQKYYENEAFWTEEALSDPFNKIRVQDTVAFIPATVKTLLDVGCGNGIFTNYLAEQKKELQITGVDRSAEALKYIKTDKLQGDIAAIPVADRSYDCSTCLEVIEHLPVPTFQKALSELARVSDKYIIISVPYKEEQGFGATECPNCHTIFNREMHLNRFDDERMQRLFDGKGFRFVKSVTTVNYRPLVGHKIAEKLRLARHNIKEFTSPICPVCGYEKPQFVTAHEQKINSNRAQQQSLKEKLAGWVRRNWPRWPNKIPGFWIIALYEREA